MEHWFVICQEYGARKEGFVAYDSMSQDKAGTLMDVQDVKLVARYFDPNRSNEKVSSL